MPAQDIAPQQPADTTKQAESPKDWFTVDEVLAREREVLRVKQGNALCISGGGIRSATFALGALQGLAELDLLEKFDYLSTVSGGGYIGSWLTAWKVPMAAWAGSSRPNVASRQTASSQYSRRRKPWKGNRTFPGDPAPPGPAARPARRLRYGYRRRKYRAHCPA